MSEEELTPRADNEFLYFAYGSNMSLRRLTAPNRAPSANPFCSGYVLGRKLTFDKVSKDGSGKCDCEFTGDEQQRIYGVLFTVSLADKAKLDRAEGNGAGYDETIVEVVTPSGVTKAVTYFATRKDSSLKPYNWYKQHVLDGAREGGLPVDYIAALMAVQSVEDSDLSRVERERSL